MQDIKRDIHTIDATDKTPGRLASEVANLLIGKHKPTYQPNIDGGDHVQVINASQIRLTGARKEEQKVYYHHSGFAGALKSKTLGQLLKENPSEVVRKAVSRMLPKNKQRNERMKRLVIKN